MDIRNEFIEPGELVRLPARADWGIGQVQSVIGNRITVNFEHAGKVVLDGGNAILETVPDNGAMG